jgi:DNA anti-recombination protein RmuC
MADKIEVEKLQSEIDKLGAVSDAIRRAPHASWTNWIPLLGGLAALVTALVGGIIQWRVTDLTIKENQVAAERKVFEAERQVLEVEKKTDQFERRAAELEAKNVALDAEISSKTALLAAAEKDLRARQEELTKAATATQDPAARQTLNAAAAETGAVANEIARHNKLVYIQFRGNIEQTIVEALRLKLQDSGYRVPDIERVAGSYSSEVRYFYNADERIAQDAAEITAAFLKERCGVTSPLPAEFVSIAPPPQQIEVWISVKCSTGPSRSR